MDYNEFESINNNTTLANNIDKLRKEFNDYGDADPMIQIAISTATGVDNWNESKYIYANDLTKVDTIIITSLVAVYFIKQADFKYTNNLINEYENMIMRSLALLYDIKNWNVYNLYDDRKKLFGKCLDDFDFDSFREQATILITNDYVNDSFKKVDKECSIEILEIEEALKLEIEVTSYLKSVFKTYRNITKNLTDEKYRKVLEMNTFDSNKIHKDGLVCDNCGERIPNDSEYCMFCGERIYATNMALGTPLSKQEVHEFVLEYFFQEVLKPEYEIVSVNSNMDTIPSFVVKKDNELIFVLVESAVAPKIPKLSTERRKEFIAHGSRFNAKCLYASVSIGSHDRDRFEKGIALKNDIFYFRFTGMEQILYIK